jgi:hypothetical protein
MFAIFGRMLPKQFATYDRDTSSWRMSGDTYLWDSGTYSGTWPDSGMTRSGVSLELPQPAHLTDESGCSSLLMTPVAAEGTKPSNTMGIARRLSTGQLFLTNQIVSLCGLDPSEAGDHTPPASAAGSGSPDAQLPGQLSILDAMGESA